MKPLFAYTLLGTLMLSGCGMGLCVQDTCSPIASTAADIYEVADLRFNGPVTGYVRSGNRYFVIGNFQTNGSTTVGGIVALTLNGEIDTTFHSGTGFNGAVSVLLPAPDGSGAVYVGGEFTNYNGTTTNYLARLSADGSLDTGFDMSMGVNSRVLNVFAVGDGTLDIYVMGYFTSYQGTAGIGRILRLQPNGVRSPVFVSGTGFDGYINAIVPIPGTAGAFYAVGSFTSYNGSPAPRAARVLGDGTLDSSFAVGVGFDSGPASLSLLSDGRLLVGTNGGSYQGMVVSKVIRLYPDGSRDMGFNPPPTAPYAFTMLEVSDGSGAIYVGGSAYPNVALVRLLSDGSLDPTFDIGTGFFGSDYVAVHALAPAPGDTTNIIVMGDFYGINSKLANGIVQLSKSGELVTNYGITSRFNGPARMFAHALDKIGSFFVYGAFSNVDGKPVKQLIRLNTDLTLDPTFQVASEFTSSWAYGAGEIASIVPAGDQASVYIGGSFTSYGGVPVGRIARLTSTGDLDTTFATGTGFNNGVLQIIPLTDGSGSLYVIGSFASYNGTAASRIIRLLSTGAVDPAFSYGTGFSGTVYGGLLGADGSSLIYTADATNYKGVAAKRVGRISANGTMDATFSANVGTAATAAFPGFTLPDGRIYLAGYFSSFNGTSRNRIVRLHSNGALDTAFVPDPNLSFYWTALAPGPNDTVYVGAGQSDAMYQGTPISLLFRLLPNGNLDTSFQYERPLGGYGDYSTNVFGLFPLTDGSGDCLLGGHYASYAGTTAYFFSRIDAEGKLK